MIGAVTSPRRYWVAWTILVAHNIAFALVSIPSIFGKFEPESISSLTWFFTGIVLVLYWYPIVILWVLFRFCYKLSSVVGPTRSQEVAGVIIAITCLRGWVTFVYLFNQAKMENLWFTHFPPFWIW